MTSMMLTLLLLPLLVLTRDVSAFEVLESSPDSPILRIQEDTIAANTSIRFGKLLGLQGLTSQIHEEQKDGSVRIRRQVSKGLLFNDVAVFLAYMHFNQRRGDILPQLPSLLEGCDFYWSYESRDTQRNALSGADQLIQAMLTRNAIKQEQVPFAYFGAHLSSVSKPLSTVGAGFDLPQISGASTSSELDAAPFFARTISTNEADARAIMVYFQSIGVQHVANVYLHNEWGIFFNTALRKFAMEMDMKLLSFPLDNNPASIESAMEDLKKSQYRYVFAAVNPWPEVFRTAYRYGVMGNPDYVWFAGEFSVSEAQQYNRTTDHDLAMALHGIGTINLYQKPYPALDAAMQEITTNPALEREYFSHLVEPQIVQNFTFQNKSYDQAFRHYTNFDAVIALGLAACNTPTDQLFTGTQLYRQLLKTQFQGASGQVSFDAKTGSRLATSVSFRIESAQLSDERSDADYDRFDSKVAAIVRGDELTVVAPFRYPNNQTHPRPAELPLPKEQLNLIPKGVQVFGYILAVLAMTLSLVCWTWAIVYRGLFVVRAAQPVFLAMLCVGTFLIGSAIIPLSFPGAYSGHEATRALNVACMAPIWLVVLGFVIAFSALHAKTWRMLKIMKSANQMIRKEVQPQDVILPFFILMTINLVLLLCMTILAPFQFVRKPMNSFDEYGRSIESYATCQYFAKGDSTPYMATLMVVDFLWTSLVMYQAYQARNLSTAFSESKYLVMTVLSLFETFLLGIPILVAVVKIPTAFYICASLICAASVAAILTPIFLPKYLHRKIERGRSAIQRPSDAGLGGRSTGQSGVSGLASGASHLDPSSSLGDLPRPSIHNQSGSRPSASTASRFSLTTPSRPSTAAASRPSATTKRISTGSRPFDAFRRISSLTNFSANQSKRTSLGIVARDDSWHFETKEGNLQNRPSAHVSGSRDNNLQRQANALGIDKHELEALDLIRDLDLESVGSKSNHCHKTC